MVDIEGGIVPIGLVNLYLSKAAVGVECREDGSVAEGLDGKINPRYLIAFPYGHFVKALLVDTETRCTVGLRNRYDGGCPFAFGLFDYVHIQHLVNFFFLLATSGFSGTVCRLEDGPQVGIELDLVFDLANSA